MRCRASARAPSGRRRSVQRGQLIAAAAPATSAMPSEAKRNNRSGGSPAGEEHPDHRREDDQRIHARFAQREEVGEALSKVARTMFAIVWLVSLT